MQLKSLMLMTTALLSAGLASTASASTFATISSQSNPWNNGPGVAPVSVGVTGFDYVTITSTGTITVNGGSNINDADGVGAYPGVTVSAANGISGIKSSAAGIVVGVFVAGALGATPADLTFGLGGSSTPTSFTSLSPLLQQLFFVGDGLTGNGTGAEQQFYVPVGATTLLLGIADAPSYNGAPGGYADNRGSYQTVITGFSTAGAVPEPATWAMMIAGFAAVGSTMRRRASRVSFA